MNSQESVNPVSPVIADDRSEVPRIGLLQQLELRCPPMPRTLLEAMELIEQPERLEVGPVTEMVERDPIVTARLLHIVNSAYYGVRHTIGSAERAVVMLGPVAVAGIVVGMNMLKLRATLEGPALECFRRLISHSIATAFLTRHILEGPPQEIGRESGSTSTSLGVGFTAGLLHDFGKIILVYNFPQAAVEFYQYKVLSDHVEEPDQRRLEQLLFGCDHCEAGEYVARKLQFPDVLTRVIAEHHEDPGREGDDPGASHLMRAVSAANCGAKVFGFEITGAQDEDAFLLEPAVNELVRRDPATFESVQNLLAMLTAQRSHLDHYVECMSSPEAISPND